MTINAIINTSLTGLFTNQAALRITGNNIANVNTPGYARQVLQQEQVIAGTQSVGVKISEVQRIVDSFLESASLTAKSNATEFTVQREFHDRLQGLLGRPDSDGTLSARVDRMFASLSELALSPADRVARQASLADLQSFTDEVSRLSQTIQDLRGDVNNQIAEQVNVVNEALRRAHELNPLIVREKVLGGETGGLEDQRTLALQTVADAVDIRVTQNADGSVNVATGTGAALIDGVLRQLEYTAPGAVTSQTPFNPIIIRTINPATGAFTGSAKALDSSVQSGRIRGLLDLRDRDLVNMSLSLGELSANMMDQLNAIHNSFSAAPAPNSLTGRPTALSGTNAPDFTGIVTFAVVDAGNQVVSTHTVDFDGAPPADFNAMIAAVNAGLGAAGTLALTNGVMSFTAANATHGVAIAQDTAAPSQRAGRGFSHFFGMNDLLAANTPGRYETGLTGAEPHNLAPGGATTFEIRDANGNLLAQHTMNAVGTNYNDLLADLNGSPMGTFMNFSLDAAGALQITQLPGFNGLDITVTADTTNHASSSVTFSGLFGIGDRYLADAAQNVGIISRIASDPGQFALSQFDLTAAPGSIGLATGDQRGVLALQALETKAVSFRGAGELASMSVSLSQYGAAVLGNAGLMAQRVTNQETDNKALSVEIEERRANVSGVNLDEELANMIVFQNSFNAAARLLTTAQELYDALLAI